MRQLNGPKPRWITGHLREFRRDRMTFFRRCASEYGDLVPLRILRYRVLLVSRPDLIEQVLVTQSRNFIKHFGLRLYKPVLGEGLVTAEGNLWRRQRKLSAPAFQASRLASYAAVMSRATGDMLRDWRAGQERDVHADMAALTLRIACQTLFGADVCPDPQVVNAAVMEMMIGLSRRWRGLVPLPWWVPSPANRRFRRGYAALTRLIRELIDRRRAAGERGDDLLSALLAARDEDDGSAMSEQQLMDEVITLFLAGHETTALALTYALHLLAQHPPAQERLRAETRDVVPGDRRPAHADLARLPYAHQVIAEAMRLYPPADFIGREALADCTIGDVHVPRGTNVFVSQWVMHHDARYFPAPDTFDPDRWTPQFERALPRFAYFPFGGGPRYCIGQTFATVEAALVLASIIHQFDLRPAPGYRLVLDPGLTLRPAGPVRIVLGRPADAPSGHAQTANTCSHRES